MRENIDFFPLDVALDSKFELIEAEYGLTGFAVIVKLLQRIYGGCGYYCKWDTDTSLIFSSQVGLKECAVSEIVSAAIRRGMFDRTVYEKYGILTSAGIQKRYFAAVSRRKIVKVKKAYLLVSHIQVPKNVYISEENVNIFCENDNIFRQSKGNESKVNITDTVPAAPAPSLEEVTEYCRLKKLRCNPKRFFDYYSKLGWKTKEGKPVDDWYSLCEKWSETEDISKATEERRGSFDTDDFFEAAVAATRRER